MFVTNRRAEIDGTFIMLEEGQQAWHFVEKRLLSPWFNVTVVRRQNDEQYQDVLFLDNVRYLRQFASLTEDGMALCSVQIVTPGWVNGSGDWLMEPLIEVSESAEGASWCYTVQGGKQYHYPTAMKESANAYSVTLYRKPTASPLTI